MPLLRKFFAQYSARIRRDIFGSGDSYLYVYSVEMRGEFIGAWGEDHLVHKKLTCIQTFLSK